MSVGSDPVPVRRPVIVTTPRTIDVITGTRQVAVGTILVPEVTFVTTTTTEQVGTESVRVGSSFNTADVTLTQLGYYNPNAPASSQFRKTFVEGIDYFNGSIELEQGLRSAHRRYQDTVGVHRLASGEFGALTDNQRDSVLIQLGYRKFYNVSFANLKTNNTISGIPTQIAWHPTWEGAYSTHTVDTSYVNASGSFVNGPNITYKQYTNTTSARLPVDGWRDKYVQLPAGAEADILRVVSQGTPTTYQEDSGDYYDQARVLYYQDKSAHTANESGDYRETDLDNSPIRWDVSYFDSGKRWYSLNDGRTGGNMVNEFQNPLWNSGGKSQSEDINGLSIYVQSGYVATTRLINNQSEYASRHMSRVGDYEELLFDVQFDFRLRWNEGDGDRKSRNRLHRHVFMTMETRSVGRAGP